MTGLKANFGIELDEILRKQGLSLTGHWPEFRAGMFTIEINSDEAVIWYGPKQERLSRCPVEAGKIAQRVSRLVGQLGSPISDEEFLNRLRQSYEKVLAARGMKNGEPVPIIEVLSEIASLLPGSYGRADFSYDLCRVRDTATRWGLHLVVATRAFTRRRQDFLWVPDDWSGKGTVYSHLKFDKVQFKGGVEMAAKNHETETVEQAERAVAEAVAAQAEQASAEAKAEQAKAADQAVADEARQVEEAWRILIESGVVTPEDREALSRRKRDRDLLALASKTLAEAKALAPDAVAVSISTSTLVYAAEDGQSPRVFPRVTTTSTRRQKPKASEAKAETSTEVGKAEVSEIPAEILKKASAELGVQWFGPANARRSKRVVARACELMGQ